MIHQRINNHPKVQDEIKKLAGSYLVETRSEQQAVVGVIKPEAVYDVIAKLKYDTAMAFTYLIDITAVDYSKYSQPMPERFEIIYTMVSPHLGVRLHIRTFLPGENPVTVSIVPIFAGANWAEREVFDMYGIKFTGHPDLKRILMPENFEGHPLKKEYPLKGRGERASFPVYESQKGHKS